MSVSAFLTLLWLQPERRCFAVAHPCVCVVDRVQRLKDARSEAAKEIEAYKASKEQEFKAFEASVRPDDIIHALGR